MLTSPRSPESKANLTNFFLIFFNDFFFIDILRSSVKLAINFPFPCLISLETRKTWSILRSLFLPFNHRRLIIFYFLFFWRKSRVNCAHYCLWSSVYINYALIFFLEEKYIRIFALSIIFSNQPTKSLQILGFGTLLLYRWHLKYHLIHYLLCVWYHVAVFMPYMLNQLCCIFFFTDKMKWL